MENIPVLPKSRLFIHVSKRTGKAIGDYDMLQDGDKIAVAVSGGKDSLALLHILRYRQTFIPIRITLIAVTIDFGLPGFSLEPAQDPGKITIIRPLAYERERTLTHLAKKEGWPDFDSFKCPKNDSSKRTMIKQVLAQLERQHPDSVVNIFRGLKNIKEGYLLNPPGSSSRVHDALPLK